MKGKFSVTTMTQSWEPPFEKTNTTVEYEISEGEDFDPDKNLDSYVFAALELRPESAVIAHSRQYTLKKNQYASSNLVVGPQKLNIPRGTEVEFSYMWGHNGTTKKIKYLGDTK